MSFKRGQKILCIRALPTVRTQKNLVHRQIYTFKGSIYPGEVSVEESDVSWFADRFVPACSLALALYQNETIYDQH